MQSDKIFISNLKVFHLFIFAKVYIINQMAVYRLASGKMFENLISF